MRFGLSEQVIDKINTRLIFPSSATSIIRICWNISNGSAGYSIPDGKRPDSLKDC
jgi:hypothetical protein